MRAKVTQLTQCMVRPCVASGFAELAVSGLASMYPAFDWSICFRPSWISARVRSRYRTGLDWTIWVTSVRTKTEFSIYIANSDEIKRSPTLKVQRCESDAVLIVRCRTIPLNQPRYAP
jgi:hypothetical protein